MKRIISVLTVMVIMAALLVATALPALAVSGAAKNCQPPGQAINDYAKIPSASTPDVFFGGEIPG